MSTLPPSTSGNRKDFRFVFDIGTIKHLGVMMYSTLPPVIGELVSNAWDADAAHVYVNIPSTAIDAQSSIVIEDDGEGMSDEEVRAAYLVIGRDRRELTQDALTLKGRKVMGRKGIGKFSAFGIADEIEIETVKDGETSRFVMNYEKLREESAKREITLPALPPTGQVTKGTRIILRNLRRFKSRSVNVPNLRRGLSRRFSVIGREHGFEVVVNALPITPDERDLKRLLENDADGRPYLWEYKNQEIKEGTGLTVSGWIGALDRTSPTVDGIQRGVAIMARGKMVQEPFVFDAVVGQQFALSYLVGELNAEFVDEGEDTIGTTRSSLVWDSANNALLKEWGQVEVNRIAREWANKRGADNERALQANPLYQEFRAGAQRLGDANKTLFKTADKLIRQTVVSNPLPSDEANKEIVKLCIDFMEFDAFNELAQQLSEEQTESPDIAKLVRLFRECEIIEAKEMMRVTTGRITTITKLQELIRTNALEVPTLHGFLKEFPWVLDPRWSLVADERRYSQLLRNEFPEEVAALPEDKRIDFLCVKESSTLVVVEIKRPHSQASVKQLEQIEEYVYFIRDYVKRTSDPDFKNKTVVGYLLCGDLVDTYKARGKAETLAKNDIFVRRYGDLLQQVENSHKEFLARYERLTKAKTNSAGEDPLILVNKETGEIIG